MPTYDYVCEECGHEFEKFQSIKASSLRKCPECGKLKLRRVIGAGAALIFRGSGFYCTDYRKGSETSSSPCASCPSGKSDSKGGDACPSGKSDSKGSDSGGGSSGANGDGAKKD